MSSIDKDFKIPSKSIKDISSPNEIANKLKSLIGNDFVVSPHARTNGSNVRKMVAKTLHNCGLPEPCNSDEYQILAAKGKGIPKLTRELIDTYIVTTGKAYNLQVWNRAPAGNQPMIKLSDNTEVLPIDIRLVLVKIDDNKVSSIIIMSPDYIQNRFGRFGKQTVKHQLIISGSLRTSILNMDDKILFYTDSASMKSICINNYTKPNSKFNAIPKKGDLFSIEILKNKLASLIGETIIGVDTKNRGQYLENIVLEKLGYDLGADELLEGGYPDVRNQLLEVKVQDSPTIDLGKYTPEFTEIVIDELDISTPDIRYLIALTDSTDNKIKGLILSSGEKLGQKMTYIADKSYKCQRSIPMSFFEDYKGQSVFNPS